ncbi:hypothetical protein [Streptomyces iakyrus]|uniref:hypothetical protein n=1 Tax=Streptomyces iakyrus TaxID=68219 RepID=UPI0036875C98
MLANTYAPGKGAAGRAYLICTTGRWEQETATTTVSEIGTADGKPRWTVEAVGGPCCSTGELLSQRVRPVRGETALTPPLPRVT